MPNEPIQPTVEQLQAEIATLKAKLGAMVPSAEKDALAQELADARKELAALKAAATAPPEKTGFFPKLF